MTWVDNAVIYQIYPRSFADGSGDGIGDLAGMRSRLPYLRELGVNAVWLSPWYTSPMADAGYDVADYRDIDPLFGTLDEASTFIQEAHATGIRVIVDIVPNHCSDRHPLFQEALRAGPGSPERELFWFFDEPANDWPSHFGGSAWSQVPDGQWYLHLFAAEQPDWNWEHPRVREEFLTTLRFWLDRGVDGFRIDVADHLVKDLTASDGWTNQEGVHEIYREWRKVADTYPQRPVFVGELWAERDEFLRYLRPDELHTGFNFAFLMSPWDRDMFHEIITATLDTHGIIGATPTWVLSNHDVVRPVTRYGRNDSGHIWIRPPGGWLADYEMGTRRARAAALLLLSLPGCAYIYQGEELGLAEVEDIPSSKLQDPRWHRSDHTDYGRDGCRVPLPWSGSAPPFGFSPTDDVEPWLPQPAAWASMTAQSQAHNPDSMLSLYRAALAHRPAGEGFAWLELGPGLLGFQRDELTCVVNFGSEPATLPTHTEVVLSSGPLPHGTLPADTTAWLR
jgi:alpha-glucosidase